MVNAHYNMVSNVRSISRWFYALHFIIGLALVLNLLFQTFDGYLAHTYSIWHLWAIIAVLFLLTWHLGLPAFSFEGDSETLGFYSSAFYFSRISPSFHKRIEFPKSHFKSFEIGRSLLRRNLILKIRNTHGKTKILKVPISYLKKSKLKHLESELNKTLRSIECEALPSGRQV